MILLLISTSVCLYRQQPNASTLHVNIISLCLHLNFISVWAEWFQAGWQTTSVSFSREQRSQLGRWKPCPPAAGKVPANVGAQGCSSTEPPGLVRSSKRQRGTGASLAQHRTGNTQILAASPKILILSLPWRFLWTKTTCHLTWELHPYRCWLRD